MAVVDELIAVLGFDLEGEANARKFNSIIDRADSKVKKFAGGVAKYGGLLATAAGAGMAALGKGVIDTSATFEKFEATLFTIEGSAEKARESMDWIAEFTKTTPNELAVVTDAFVKLKAYGIDPVANDTLRILGDTAAAMNKPLNQAVEAFADAATGEFERLKEFGVRARQTSEEVTFTWTKNGEQLTKVVKNNGDEIRKFLLENMGDRFNGAMMRQSKTWSGMMSNLGDAWTLFLKRVGDGGFFESVKGRLAGLLDTVDRLEADGTLDRWSANLSATFNGAAEGIGWFAERIGGHVEYIRDNFDSLKVPIAIFAALLAGLLIYTFPVTTGLLLMGLAADQLLTYMSDGGGVIGEMVTQIQELTGASEGGAEALIALHPPLAALLTMPYDQIKDGFGKIVEKIESLSVVQKATTWIRELTGAIDGLSGAMKLLNPQFWPLLSGNLKGAFGGDQKANPNAPKQRGKRISATQDAIARLKQEKMLNMANNLSANLAKTDSAAVGAKMVSEVTDNRDQSVTNHVNVGGVHVKEAASAPGALGAAVGNAAAGAVSQRTQTESEIIAP